MLLDMTMLLKMPVVMLIGFGFSLIEALPAQTAPLPPLKKLSLAEQARQSYQDELLQTRAYCQNLEVRLSYIRKQFSVLGSEVTAAEVAWETSPFGKGDQIIQEKLAQALGEQEARSQVYSRMDQAMPTSDRLINFQEMASASKFLKSVTERSLGHIDDRQIRGTLLAHYSPFLDRPETEWDAGFSEKITHTTGTVPYVFFRVPMSWKRSHHPDLTQDQMVYTSGYGQGMVWVSIQVRPTTDDSGKLIRAEQAYEKYSPEALRLRCRSVGSELSDYEKIQIKDLSAIHFTITQATIATDPYAAKITQTIQIYSGNRVISFLFHVIQPPGAVAASDTLERYQPVIQNIYSSLSFAP